MKVRFLMQDTRALYGAERATLRLVSGLAAAGVPVRVLLLDEARLDSSAPSPLADAFRAIAPVETIPVAGRLSRAAVRRIRDLLLADAPRAILHSTGYKADVHAVLASRSSTLFPVVSTVHGWLFRRDIKERLFLAANLWALRRCSRVVVLSAFYENYLLRRGFSPLQLARIPTAYPPDAVPPADAADALWRDPDAPFTYGMLGRLSDEKTTPPSSAPPPASPAWPPPPRVPGGSSSRATAPCATASPAAPPASALPTAPPSRASWTPPTSSAVRTSSSSVPAWRTSP